MPDLEINYLLFIYCLFSAELVQRVGEHALPLSLYLPPSNRVMLPLPPPHQQAIERMLPKAKFKVPDWGLKSTLA